MTSVHSTIPRKMRISMASSKLINSRDIIRKTRSNLRCHTKYKLPKKGTVNMTECVMTDN